MRLIDFGFSLNVAKTNSRTHFARYFGETIKGVGTKVK